MTAEEFSLHYHRLCFSAECANRTGFAFQDLFEQIMRKFDPSFHPVKPMGRAGDWKCDGYASKTRTVYQCYAPENVNAKRAAEKVSDDFLGAKAAWGDQMKRWVFVWSWQGKLPPQVVAAISEIKESENDVVIEDWSRERLWKVVKQLGLSDRESILGLVPRVTEVTKTTSAEIETLLNHLCRQTFEHEITGLDITPIAEKLSRNNLSASVTAIVKPAVPVARLVCKYVTKHPDPYFGPSISHELHGRYTAIAGSGVSPDSIFFQLLQFVQKGNGEGLQAFWAGAGILTYFFELCDIFEK